MQSNATGNTLRERILALPGAPHEFDCIFAIHFLNAIAAPTARYGAEKGRSFSNYAVILAVLAAPTTLDVLLFIIYFETAAL